MSDLQATTKLERYFIWPLLGIATLALSFVYVWKLITTPQFDVLPYALDSVLLQLRDRDSAIVVRIAYRLLSLIGVVLSLVVSAICFRAGITNNKHSILVRGSVFSAFGVACGLFIPYLGYSEATRIAPVMIIGLFAWSFGILHIFKYFCLFPRRVVMKQIGTRGRKRERTIYEKYGRESMVALQLVFLSILLIWLPGLLNDSDGRFLFLLFAAIAIWYGLLLLPKYFRFTWWTLALLKIERTASRLTTRLSLEEKLADTRYAVACAALTAIGLYLGAAMIFEADAAFPNQGNQNLFFFFRIAILSWFPMVLYIPLGYHAYSPFENERQFEIVRLSLLFGLLTPLALTLILFCMTFLFVSTHFVFGFEPELVQAIRTTFELIGRVSFFVLISGPWIWLSYLVGLLLSIFWKGTIDPRYAFTKASAFTLLTFMLGGLFLLAEAWGSALLSKSILPGTWSPALATLFVSLSFRPLRSFANQLSKRILVRIAPDDELMKGTRKPATVVFIDLVGYTRLSAENEKDALLHAGVLHKLAYVTAGRHSGRLVKTIGDAAMMTFQGDASALAAVAAIKAAYLERCAALEITPLEITTGMHSGEVIEGKNGDVFGKNVNLAARLQTLAKAGEVVVSSAIAKAEGFSEAMFEWLGDVTLKNVPEPVSCYRLVSG